MIGILLDISVTEWVAATVEGRWNIRLRKYIRRINEKLLVINVW